MKQFILIRHIHIQDANAVAGFTWGFPAITNFLGYVHALQRRINEKSEFSPVNFRGCAVIAHEHHVKTYKAGSAIRFTQSRNPPYLDSHTKVATPPVIEEGKMNMVVSLLIEPKGRIKNIEALCDWLLNQAQRQRLAGGTILSIKSIRGYTIDDENPQILKQLKRDLLPGFVLLNRCDLLEEHYKNLGENDLFDAWKDFIALKRKARPKCDEIEKHLKSIAKKSEANRSLYETWKIHLNKPYFKDDIPQEIQSYFGNLGTAKDTKVLLKQWSDYCSPSEKTSANWEYQPKPNKGYLIPIMCGYKAISSVYKNEKIANTRDNETDICFVEAAHSIGEWRSVHRWHDLPTVSQSIWQYHYTEHWYLCCHDHQVPMQDLNQDSINTIQDVSDW